ncbi:MAG: endonuclease Q family protein [bacterium]|nr:endonuclease Q family protein [bacterium]
MRITADFHIHSRFSRACSKELTLPSIAQTCAVRGIDVCVTGDFTHPVWRKEISEQLVERAEGVYELQASTPSGSPSRMEGEQGNMTRFLLGTELSCIYKHNGKTRRVHHLVIAPSLQAIDRIIATLEKQGRNLKADGRPILGLPSKDLLELCLTADERTLVIPAHAWTPWFAIFGSESGYDSIEECFEDLAPHVLAVETGLSSDPPMNWRCSQLDRVALVSSSDAHSLQKLGREATVLDVEALTFTNVREAIRNGAPARYDARNANRIVQTIEFFPEEGKYHADGHRVCNVRCTPRETKRWNACCPQCKKPMTVGVCSRVDKLADREGGFIPPRAPSYTSIVPLIEVIMEAFAVKSLTSRVRACYDTLTTNIGNEFHVLLDAPLADIARVAPPEVTEAIRRVRAHELDIAPGYDGEFGTVRIFSDAHPRPAAQQRVLL